MLVISLNIQKHKKWDSVSGTRHLLNLIIEQSPDVIFLQEVLENKLLDFVKHHQNYEIFFSPTRKTHGSYMGNVIIVKSKFSILKQNSIDISCHKWDKRNAQFLMIKQSQDDFLLSNIHFGLRKGWRAHQWAQVYEYIASQNYNSLVIGGDFNANLSERASWFSGKDLIIADCGKTFPAWRPLRKIDGFILGKKLVESVSGFEAGHYKVPLSISSDHVPIWLSIKK